MVLYIPLTFQNSQKCSNARVGWGERAIHSEFQQPSMFRDDIGRSESDVRDG